MIRAAFTLPDRVRWTGGYQYFINLFRVLHRHGSGKVRPVVFVAPDTPEADLAPLGGDIAQVVRSPAFSGALAGRRLARALLLGCDRAAARLYERERIDVVFESARYHGWRFPRPAIAWLPDFQHRLLPELFGRRAWLRRELGFRAQAGSGRLVMLSSQASKAEFESFYPGHAARARVVPFAVELPAMAAAAPDVRGKYGLPGAYFYLPNQFWAHKNHIVVIEALKLLADRSIDVAVAASGAPADYRRPGLKADLEARVAELGLRERFRFLGLVPREDVYGLMRHCVALVNPSRCEGWSTVVEEARALGVPMVLSDIAVHREQAADRAAFFDPGSPLSAADALQRAVAGGMGPTAADGQDYAARLRRFAGQFEDVVQEACR
ncbi:MAG TPA: glycosyltransferase family 1 protein [Burkholderiales bacterium]|nr:glycosyltransferase family 1 protein [Burkholderiales bacterium]